MMMADLAECWLTPPPTLHLADNEVHIWRAKLDLPSPHMQRCKEVLSTDEIDKADHFFFERDRQRYIARRGILRFILGRYLNLNPGWLRFAKNCFGKPFLFSATATHSLKFNCSESQGLALYAFCRGQDLGIDVEFHDKQFAYANIVERWFTANEAALLLTGSADVAPERFLQIWTRKEAYVKALGKGLSLDLDRVDVSPLLEKPTTCQVISPGCRANSQWSFLELLPERGYTGALAVKGCDWEFKLWEWGVYNFV